jgi:hypothetical protein
MPITRPSSGLTEEDLQPYRDYAEDDNVRINNEGVPIWLVTTIGAIIIAEITWFGVKVVNIGESLVKVETQVDGLDRRVTRLEDKR